MKAFLQFQAIHFILIISLFGLQFLAFPTFLIGQQYPDITFSKPPGFYDAPIELEVKTKRGHKIAYSLDGTEPGFQSPLLEGSLQIDSTTVLRVRIFDGPGKAGPESVHTWFIKEPTHLPIFSIIIDPTYLWDEDLGLYENWDEDYQYPALVEFYDESHDLKIRTQLKLKLFGASSLRQAKKSFRLKADADLGDSVISYPFFDDRPYKDFKGLFLRADVTDGHGGRFNERAGDRIRNELMYEVNRAMGERMDMQAYRPVTLFLNGTYWGLYTLMERKGKGFIFNRYGLRDLDILETEDLDVNEGDTLHYTDLLRYMSENDLEEQEVYKEVQRRMDTESYIDYFIYEIYTATFDYGQNIRFWRPRTENGRWKWIGYDYDHFQDLDDDRLGTFIEDEPESIFLLGPLCKNETFRADFVNRFADYLNYGFHPDTMKKYMSRIVDQMGPEKQRDFLRWKREVKFLPQGTQIKQMEEWAEKRPEYLRQHIQYRLDLEDWDSLHFDVSPPGSGEIQVSTLSLTEFPWSGFYNSSIKVPVTAIPKKGWTFSHWRVNGQEMKQQMIQVAPGKAKTIEAVFIQD